MSDRSNQQAGGVFACVLALFAGGGKACSAAKVGAVGAAEVGAASRAARVTAEAGVFARSAEELSAAGRAAHGVEDLSTFGRVGRSAEPAAELRGSGLLLAGEDTSHVARGSRAAREAGTARPPAGSTHEGQDLLEHGIDAVQRGADLLPQDDGDDKKR
jgi:hypothetical protein